MNNFILYVSSQVVCKNVKNGRFYEDSNEKLETTFKLVRSSSYHHSQIDTETNPTFVIKNSKKVKNSNMNSCRRLPSKSIHQEFGEVRNCLKNKNRSF